MRFLFTPIHSTPIFKSVLGEMVAFSKGTKRFFDKPPGWIALSWRHCRCKILKGLKQACNQTHRTNFQTPSLKPDFGSLPHNAKNFRAFDFKIAFSLLDQMLNGRALKMIDNLLFDRFIQIGGVFFNLQTHRIFKPEKLKARFGLFFKGIGNIKGSFWCA